MKVLLTGASSFTGYWFVRALAEAGHEVTATYRSSLVDYGGVRARRVRKLGGVCVQVPSCAFGDDACLELIRSQPWDVLCHHAADVTDYKSPDFDVNQALANNTRQLRAVLERLREQGCGKVILTGSVFEAGEGAGSDGLPAFSPYGVSKAVTASVFEYHTRASGLGLGKFVISNPFGPLEEPRFTDYLLRMWFRGETPSVRTPRYVRDNIHVSLLAEAYRAFVEDLPACPGFRRLNPSGYIGCQGDFAKLYGRKLGPLLGMDCPVKLEEQTDFGEPRVRINTDIVDGAALGWNETAAWRDLADYYRETHTPTAAQGELS